jgi:hypothetical protein
MLLWTFLPPSAGRRAAFLASCALFVTRERRWRAEILRGMLAMAEPLTEERERGGMVQDPISLRPQPDEASQTFRARIL